MNLSRWWTNRTPSLMLRMLSTGPRTYREEDDRKLRLLAVACWRRVWELLPDDRFRRLIEAQEAFADGTIDEPGLAAAVDRAAEVRGVPDSAWREAETRHVALFGLRFDPESMSWATSHLAGDRAGLTVEASASEPEAFEIRRLATRAESRAHSDLLREIFGDPFRPTAVDPAWLAWNGGTVPDLARFIYQERAFDRLPVLADALEEAGCTDADLLAHCRAEFGHVRGCWALDALLRLRGGDEDAGRPVPGAVDAGRPGPYPGASPPL